MAANSNESGQSILHNSMPKEKFVDVLRQKTYPYTWSNTYDAALFLSIVNENQISIYYRGKGSPASWYEADVEEEENGTVIKGKFVMGRDAKRMLSIFLFIMWCGLLWISFPRLLMLVATVPFGLIVSAIMIMWFRTSNEDNEKAIEEFLEELDEE